MRHPLLYPLRNVRFKNTIDNILLVLPKCCTNFSNTYTVLRRQYQASLFSLLLCCLAGTTKAQHLTIHSPDKLLSLRFSIVKNKPVYAVFYGTSPLIRNSTIGLSFEGKDFFGNDIRMGKTSIKNGRESYRMPVGKTSEVSEAYNEAVIPLFEQQGKKRQVNFHVRIFNDAVAFRYEFPSQANWEQYVLTDENTSFNITGDPLTRMAYLEHFNTSHEHRYHTTPLSQVPADTLIDMPALFSFDNGLYMAITEAALKNYAGMSLVKHNGALQSQLTPLPGQQEIKVKAKLPHQSPWRVMMISNRIGALIESNILTNLNTACTATDLSWLKPGKASFHWWNGDVLPDTTFEAGINFDFNKYYIDFCAANRIEYHTVIGNRGVAWYKNDGVGYQPGPSTDITQPFPGLNLQEICDYARSKGVGIRFWTHWQALYPKIDSAFALFQKWGIAGMMVDFMDRDDQEMINIQEEILQKAMTHHLEIQFHGVSKPTGLNRTYPNESTREGTLNYENNKWGNLITPDDDIQIPFTRLLAGPTDYHLGGFRAMPLAGYKQQFTKPYMLGTRCHMLAMYLVLENALSMVCDFPAAYEGQPGFSFLKEVPTVWDQTVIPDAVAGEFIVTARRKKQDWYIGTITNKTARHLTISLAFLPPGTYAADIYQDAPDASNNPNHLVQSKQFLTSTDTLNIQLASGGGCVMKLTKRQ